MQTFLSGVKRMSYLFFTFKIYYFAGEVILIIYLKLEDATRINHNRKTSDTFDLKVNRVVYVQVIITTIMFCTLAHIS